MIKTIIINSPVTLNRIITKIRFELIMSGYSEPVIYSSLDLLMLISDSSLFSYELKSDRITADPSLVGYLFSNRVYLDYQLQGLEFHFNDVSIVRQNKINSVFEDTTFDSLITYKIEIEPDLTKQI